MSSTILRIGAYRFFFYSREEKRAHIHIEEGNNTARFWLDPEVKLAESYGFSTRDLNRLEELVIENQQTLMKGWSDFHG